ncbi:hypothetical protein A5893_15970 [Pedobacter psychrophilus]|uniref:Outer membrane protein beta-barrel domain-containing protein n=1 Tax=Pedobacter psychrophilus TaxID=1826909 RepID=A0A179DBI9_9SPHI|nr:hypothetical protein [Pedobacter psychrophilus]OAQ38284.1 hypothetical protein A5893_15970 [Pedobacter psychrophilus]
MKKIFFSILLSLLIGNKIFAQEKEKIKTDFKFFNWSSLSYTFGLNDAVLSQKINSLHIKTVFGLGTPQTGFGIGLENATFRNTNSSNGVNFNTLSFSGNLHQLLKPISDDDLNFFIKGGAGYAVRIFDGYDKGLNYEASIGAILTTRKKSKYFLQAIYNYQEIDGFALVNGKPKIMSFGLGIGTWVSR